MRLKMKDGQQQRYTTLQEYVENEGNQLHRR